ncbi:MAG TPA: hypothetical protein VGI35_07620 [Steroidobacteraceae bacterium]
MSNWAKNWVLDGASALASPLILNPNGTTEFRLQPQSKKSQPTYYTVHLTSANSAPAGWKDVVLFPLGMREVPDTFSIAGPLASGTAGQYLAAAVTMQASIAQTVNNFRLEGDLAVVGSTGNSATVTLYRVQRAVAPKDWYLVIYVKGGGTNPDGAGIGHNN